MRIYIYIITGQEMYYRPLGFIWFLGLHVVYVVGLAGRIYIHVYIYISLELTDGYGAKTGLS